MKLKRILIVLLALSFLVICADKDSASAKTIKMKIAASSTPDTHPQILSIKSWANKLEKRTNGRVKIAIFAGTMGDPRELYDMVKDGVVEMAQFPDFMAGGRLPIISSVGGLPFEIRSAAMMQAVYEGLMYEGFLTELNDFKLLYFTTVPGIFLFSKKKVNTLEDWNGLTIRAGGPTSTIVEAFKGTPISMPGSEEYMALERGVLDANLTGPDNVVARKEWEVTKYALDAPLMGGGIIFLMNKGVWNSLPADVQVVIEQLNSEEAYLWLLNLEKAGHWDKIREKMEVYSLTPEHEAQLRKAASPLVEKWIAKMEKQGIPGRKIVESTRAIVKRY